MERPEKMMLLWNPRMSIWLQENLLDIKVCDGMLKLTKTVCIYVITQTIQVGFTNTD